MSAEGIILRHDVRREMVCEKSTGKNNNQQVIIPLFNHVDSVNTGGMFEFSWSKMRQRRTCIEH